MQNLILNWQPQIQNFSWVLPVIVLFLAFRIAFDLKNVAMDEKRSIRLLVLGLVSAAILFKNPHWGVWNVMIVTSAISIAAAMTTIKRVWLKNVYLLSGLALCMGGLIGIFSGYSLVLSAGPSMWPTSPKTPSMSLLDTVAYKHSSVRRGDDVEVAIPYTSNDSEWPSGRFRKRVWGLPGDQVDVTALGIRVNGEWVAHCFDRSERVEVPSVWMCEANWGNKTTPLVWGLTNELYVNHYTYKLGPEEMFVMGDNSVESSDSRMFGPVNSAWVTGRFGRRP